MLRMRNGTSKSPFRPRLSRQLIMPRPPCGRCWTRQKDAESNIAHKWLYGVSDVRADFLRRLRKKPLRHCENPPVPTPTGDYPPRASHFHGGQRLTTLARLLGSGGAKAIVADSLLMKQQLLVINRSRKRAPNLSVIDRFLLGFWSLFLSPHHIPRSAIIIRPSTLLRFHETLKKRKYRLLYTSRRVCCTNRTTGAIIS